MEQEVAAIIAVIVIGIVGCLVIAFGPCKFPDEVRPLVPEETTSDNNPV